MRETYLSRDELVAFITTLPTRRVAAGALIRNELGGLLLVQPNYKDGWILPGGTVEAGEAPQAGCFREVREELGLELSPGRLVLLFHGLEMGIWGDSTYYMYDAGVIPADTPITLQDDELITYRWVAEADLEQYVNIGQARRLRACLRALQTGEVIEMTSKDPSTTASASADACLS